MSVENMDLFSERQKETFDKMTKQYKKDLQNAGSDYKEVQKVQEAYAKYFNSAGTHILATNEKKSAAESDLLQRLYFTKAHKLLICSSFVQLKEENLVEEREYTPICLECSKTIEGLGLAYEKDNSYICWSCIDEDNYTDYKDIIVCNFTAGGNGDGSN